MSQNPVAVAADYADAMIVARRGKNALFLILLLMLVAQLVIFLCARAWPGLIDAGKITTDQGARAFALLEYLVAGIDFLGIILVIVLDVVLLLILMIMVVGRLIGVARVTSAFLWCVLLTVMLFPWQAFLSNSSLRMADNKPTSTPPAVSVAISPGTTEPAPSTNPTAGNATATPAPQPNINPPLDFRIPGVLYTWAELTHPTRGARFSGGLNPEGIIHWARFLVVPIVAVIILMSIQVKSSRGLKAALGEADYETSDIPQSPAE